ncbi:MAG: lamin tail domain-containing protein, partial [Anaerolineae bacterium]
MPYRPVGLGLLILILVLSGCDGQATPAEPTATAPEPDRTEAVSSPEAEVPPSGIWISEVLPGIHGVDNNLEFIELYNAGRAAVDLDGWSLWYRLDDKKDEHLLYAWEGQADIPGHGHFLLVRSGKDVGAMGDAEYTSSLFELRGGLSLRDPEDQVVDTLVWGEGPATYRAG